MQQARPIYRGGIAAMLPPDAQTYGIFWDGTADQATSIKANDMVDVVWLPADGSPTQTILKNVQVIKTIHQKSSPTIQITIEVTPEEKAILPVSRATGVGTTALDGVEAAPVPAAFSAVTVKV